MWCTVRRLRPSWALRCAGGAPAACYSEVVEGAAEFVGCLCRVGSCFLEVFCICLLSTLEPSRRFSFSLVSYCRYHTRFFGGLLFGATLHTAGETCARIVKASVRPAPLLQTAYETTAVVSAALPKTAASVCSSPRRCCSGRAKNMGATQSTRPKVLVYGAPHAGKKSLVKALGDAEFELFTTDDGADADAVVYVVDANQPTQWTVPIELLHSVNLKLGRTVPLCVVVNKSDVQGSAPAQQVLPQLAAAASKVDACAAVGGRVWRVVEASAVTGDIGVAALKRVLRHLCDMSDVSASILAPRSIGGVAGEACGASASLP